MMIQIQKYESDVELDSEVSVSEVEPLSGEY